MDSCWQPQVNQLAVVGYLVFDALIISKGIHSIVTKKLHPGTLVLCKHRSIAFHVTIMLTTLAVYLKLHHYAITATQWQSHKMYCFVDKR